MLSVGSGPQPHMYLVLDWISHWCVHTLPIPFTF